MTAQEAYQEWKRSHKINLRVYTDEQMFEIGFNSRNEEVEQLQALVTKKTEKKKREAV